MIWLLAVLGLRWAGLPWFAALALVILAFSFFAGLDPLLAILEFSRLRELEELLALPMILFGARLLVHAHDRPATCTTASNRSAAVLLCGGSWLLGRAADRGTCSGGSQAVAALLLAPSGGLILIWGLMHFLSPGRTPELQQLLLAGLVPVLVVVLLMQVAAFAPRSRAPKQHPQLRASVRESWPQGLAWCLIIIALAGLYLGRWGLLEAVTLSVVVLAGSSTLRRQPDLVRMKDLFLASMREFGEMALLLGLGLAWAALVFDSGLDRHWLAAALPAAGGSQAAATLAGVWLGVAWISASWISRPLPALIIGAPFLIPAALAAGLRPELIVMLSVLSLYLGRCLAQTGSDLRCLPAPLLAIGLLLTAPMLSIWLPLRMLGGA